MAAEIPRSSPIRNRRDAVSFLYGRLDYERATVIPYQESHFPLERMRRLCSLLGDPHVGLRVVHVAGTKGKGSTTTMISSILSAAGYRTGSYTSPHLRSVEERIAVNGCPCTSDELVELVRQVQPAVLTMDQDRVTSDDVLPGPTYFEILTAMAFLHFRHVGADVTVLEVGLGGRLDSTNVCEPICCVITSISRDHVIQLGPTLRAIAREKAGILKPGVPVISGVVRGSARQVIIATARQLDAPVRQLGRDFQCESRPGDLTRTGERPWTMDYREPGCTDLTDLHLGVLGQHQHANASLAIAACHQLQRRGFKISESAYREGLDRVRCPARVEVLTANPLTILDTAHNEASLMALLQTLHDVWPGRPIVAVFGTTRGKEFRAMLRRLLPCARQLVLTQYQESPRAESVDRLVAAARALQRVHADARACSIVVRDDPKSALQTARDLARDQDITCITGSFFLAAEILAL